MFSKKFALSLFVSIAALVMFSASQAAALNSIELTPTTQTVTVGDQVNILLSMNFDDVTTGGGFEVSYDSIGLSFVSFSFDSAYGGFTAIEMAPADGYLANPFEIGFGFFSVAPPYGVSGENVIGTLVFEALAPGAGATSTISTSASNYVPGPFYGPADLNPLVVTYGSAQVLVSSYPPIPEPSTALLLLVGLTGLSAFPNWVNRSKNK